MSNYLRSARNYYYDPQIRNLRKDILGGFNEIEGIDPLIKRRFYGGTKRDLQSQIKKAIEPRDIALRRQGIYRSGGYGKIRGDIGSVVSQSLAKSGQEFELMSEQTKAASRARATQNALALAGADISRFSDISAAYPTDAELNNMIANAKTSEELAAITRRFEGAQAKIAAARAKRELYGDIGSQIGSALWPAKDKPEPVSTWKTYGEWKQPAASTPAGYTPTEEYRTGTDYLMGRDTGYWESIAGGGRPELEVEGSWEERMGARPDYGRGIAGPPAKQTVGAKVDSFINQYGSAIMTAATGIFEYFTWMDDRQDAEEEFNKWRDDTYNSLMGLAGQQAGAASKLKSELGAVRRMREEFVSPLYKGAEGQIDYYRTTEGLPTDEMTDIVEAQVMGMTNEQKRVLDAEFGTRRMSNREAQSIFQKLDIASLDNIQKVSQALELENDSFRKGLRQTGVEASSLLAGLKWADVQRAIRDAQAVARLYAMAKVTRARAEEYSPENMPWKESGARAAWEEENRSDWPLISYSRKY